MATRPNPPNPPNRSLSNDDSRSAVEIRRDIDRERRSLDLVLSALERKLSPLQLSDQLWERVKSRLGEGGGELAAMARRHPLPLALIGAGFGWLLVETVSGRWMQAPGNGRTAERLGNAGGRRASPRPEVDPLALGAVALGAGIVAGLALSPDDGGDVRWTNAAADWSGQPTATAPAAPSDGEDLERLLRVRLERAMRDADELPRTGPVDDTRPRH